MHNTYISKLPTTKMDILGELSIPKINLNKTIYNLNSNKNNVEKNVTILKGSTLPDNNNSIIFLAAHSGNGNNAYFDNIKYLNKDDKVYFTYQNITYTYIVTKKREITKNGYINGNRYKNKELVLTTCSDNPGKQLLIHCIIDKEND